MNVGTPFRARSLAEEPRSETRKSFTLLELLIVLAVIALVVGLLVPALRGMQQSAQKVRELSAARQLMVGYISYADDHRGVLMPGYYGLGGLPANDESGNPVGPWPAPARYPWRLAPYLDYNLRGLYLDQRVLEELTNQQQYHYLISLFPSLGINAVFVGGDTNALIPAYDETYEALYGKYYLTRLSQSKHPARLIVFGSARFTGEGVPGGGSVVEGYHRLEPPYLLERDWQDNYSPDAEAADFGYVSLRHHFREAAIGFLDGHAGTLSEGSIQDMRHWADQATRPDWTLEPKSP